MFSPALLSTMLHEVWKGSAAPPHPPFELNLAAMVRQITAMGPKGSHGTLIPIVIHSERPGGVADRLRLPMTPQFGEMGTGQLWGYVPLGSLVRYVGSGDIAQLEPEREMVDLGPPMETSAANSVEADLEDRCTKLFSRAYPSAPKAVVAFIDEGRHVPGASPQNFNGRVRHLLTTDVEMERHALEVLTVLLERLDNRGVLSDVEIVCSLVVPGSRGLSAQAFDRATAPDLLDAIRRVGLDLQTTALPAVINISMGTHVGPHNGESPVEDACRAMLLRGNGTGLRFVLVAAGNHGASGVHSRCDLRAGQRNHVTLRTGPQSGGALLVETWWQEPPGGANLHITVEGRRIGGSRIMIPLVLTPSGGQGVLTQDAWGRADRRVSLYAAGCRHGFSCAALELSGADPLALANIELNFSFQSQTNLVVHSWITVDPGRQSVFVTGGGPGDSLVVPATDPEVIAVAGADHHRQPWQHSSVGPISTYLPGWPFVPHLPPYAAFGHRTQPSIAHLAALDSRPANAAITDWGTSYASPRASADSVALLLDPSVIISNRDDLLQALLANVQTSGWDPVLGFGCAPL